MGFFKSNTSRNIKACTVSIILLNYNCACTSYVLYLISRVVSVDTQGYTMCTLSLMLGLLFGQILFGVFGDTLGRKRSFLGSSLTMLVGSVLSIFSGFTFTANGTLVEFSIFRFILGVGAGGLFPLVAAITRESSQEEIANANIAQVFGPFGSIGLVFAPLMVFLLTGVNVGDDWKWRIVLAIGAVPAALLLFMDVEETMAPQPQQQQQQHALIQNNAPDPLSGGCAKLPVSLELFLNELSVVFSSPSMRSYMISTSLSWFFSDILHYGNVVMQVKFFDELLHQDQYDDDYNFSLAAMALLGVGSATCFWIGGLSSVLALRRISALALQLHGFALSACAFFLVTISKVLLPSGWWPVTIMLYATTYVFNGLGPAPTTFLIPSFLFPASIRSTANGIAAAVGKIGSIVGILVASYVGLEISNLMACFGAVALMGMGSTLVTIQTHFHSARGFGQHPSPSKLHRRRSNKSGSYQSTSAIEDGDDGEGGLSGDGVDEEERISLFGSLPGDGDDERK